MSASWYFHFSTIVSYPIYDKCRLDLLDQKVVRLVFLFLFFFIMSTHYSTFSSILYLTSVGLFGCSRKNVGHLLIVKCRL